MKLTFRWYGPSDPVSLTDIRQIPRMIGIITSLSHIIPGDVWSAEEIFHRKEQIERHGMNWSVAESLPVHEEIKWGGPQRDKYIENYQKSLQNLAKIRVPIVCYNFMPICDWMRTKLCDPFPDGSTGLSYDHEDMKTLSPEKILGWNMPAWVKMKTEEMQKLRSQFEMIDEKQLFENLRYFLLAVIPTAEEYGIRLAIHPDDPPWSIFGLPRIVKNEEDLQAILEISNYTANGITFCTGSLGADAKNNLGKMVHKFGKQGRIHFAHLRSVQILGDKKFRETAHADRSENTVTLAEIMHAFKEIHFAGPMRPDHGRTIWGEKNTFQGYGLYDRALGAMYLQGLWDAP